MYESNFSHWKLLGRPPSYPGLILAKFINYCSGSRSTCPGKGVVPSLIPMYRFDFLCVFYFIIAYFFFALFTIQLRERMGWLVVYLLKEPVGRPAAETSFRSVEFAQPKHLLRFTLVMPTSHFPFQAHRLHWTTLAPVPRPRSIRLLILCHGQANPAEVVPYVGRPFLQS